MNELINTPSPRGLWELSASTGKLRRREPDAELLFNICSYKNTFVIKKTVLITPPYRWGNCGTEQLNDSPNLVHSRFELRQPVFGGHTLSHACYDLHEEDVSSPERGQCLREKQWEG